MSTHTDHLSRLPPELVGYIIDELRYHKRTLMNAILASRLFLPFCRPHLFRILKVPLKPVEQFADHGTSGQAIDIRFLAESTLVSYVRDLRVEPPNHYSTDAYITALVLLLEKLSQIQAKIQALSILGTPPNQHRVHWTALPSSLQSVFLKLLQSQPIVLIHIYDINDFPPQLFRHCRLLKRLIFNIPTFEGTVRSLDHKFDADSERSNEKIELESLEISVLSRLSQLSANLFTHPQSPLCLSKLVRLSVDVRTLEDHNACQILIDNSKDSLRDFKLRISGSRDFIILALNTGMYYVLANDPIRNDTYKKYD